MIERTSDKPLEEGNSFPIIRDEKNNYIYSLKDIGSNNIVVNKFDAELNGEQVFNIKPIVIDPNKQKDKEINRD